MKTKPCKKTSWLSRLGIIALCAYLTGCLPDKKVIWSPDGSRAGVLSGDELYLCDAQGKLSSMVLSGVMNYAWLPDSQRLVVTHMTKINSWKELAGELKADQLKPVTDLADSILARIRANSTEVVSSKDQDQKGDSTLPAAFLYLKENHGTIFEVWAKDNEKARDPEVLLFTLQVVQVPVNGKTELGTILCKTLTAPAEIRPAPSRRTIAWVNKTNALFVAALDGSHPLQLVEPRTALFPDWTADSRALVYVRPAGEGEAQCGILYRKELFDVAGKFTENMPEDLAGSLFDGTCKVRCLRDGRILFSSTELHLPLTVKDIPQRENIFVLDSARQATLVRLIPREAESETPQKCWSFEVSPDEKRISLAADDGRIVVMTMATGAMETVQTARGDKTFKFVPTWRNAEELTFAAIPEKAGDTQTQKSAVSLWSTDKVRPLSETWPEEVLSRLFN